MLIRQFTYSAVTVDLCSLEPAETYTFDAAGSKDCVGTLYVNGVIQPEGGWGKIEKHQNYRPREQWGGWSDPTAAKGSRGFQASAEGALWVCLSHANEVDPQTLDGKLTIPAGWGFVVGSGDVLLGDPAGKIMLPPQQAISFEDNRKGDFGSLRFLRYSEPVELGPVDGAAQAGEIGNYFRPMEKDQEVTGNGDLLLVR